MFVSENLSTGVVSFSIVTSVIPSTPPAKAALSFLFAFRSHLFAVGKREVKLKEADSFQTSQISFVG